MLRVLLVAHSLPPDEQSGTPLTAFGYATALTRRGCDVTVVYATPGRGSWTWRPARDPSEGFARVPVPRLVDDQEDVEWSVTAASRPLTRTAEAGIEQLLTSIDPDVVHVVNNVRLPLELPELAKRRGLPVVRSVTGLEDLCGLVIPVSAVPAGRGACAPPLSPGQCARCVRATRPALTASFATAGTDDHAVERLLERKRARAAYQFGDVFDAVVFPSEQARVTFERSLPLPPGRVHVIEMGVDLEPWGGEAVASARPSRERHRGAPVTFVALSTKEVAKGISDVVDGFASPKLASRSDWRLRLLGGGDESLVAPLAGHPNVDVGGAYDARDVPRILDGADVGLSMSRAETFHRTTREYLLAGLPVFGTPVGGIPAVVVDGWNGRLLEPARPEQLARAVVELLDRPERLADLRAAACATYVRPIDAEVADLLAVYEQVTATVRRR